MAESNIISEREFEDQTANIDKSAIRRSRITNRVALITLLCIVAAALIYGAVWGCARMIHTRQAELAEETFIMLRYAKTIGKAEVDGPEGKAAVANIYDFALQDNNTVKVTFMELNPETISTFKKVFPNARRVVFEEKQLAPSIAKLTPEEKTLPNLRTEVTDKSPYGMHFVIENTSRNYTYELSDYFYLEQCKEGVWYSVPGMPKSPTPGYGVIVDAAVFLPQPEPITVSPGESIPVELAWVGRYGTLQPGQYRAIQVLSVKTDKEKDETYQATYTIAIEFKIG